GVLASTAGCNSIPGASCAFDRGEAIAEATGDARAFLDASMELKKATDALEKDWDAEVAALAKELGTAPNLDVILPNINATISEAKVKASCEITFEAEASAGASAGAGAAAGPGGAAAGAGAAAYAKVNVKFDAKCKAEASVKAKLDVTLGAVRVHYPVLL